MATSYSSLLLLAAAAVLLVTRRAFIAHPLNPSPSPSPSRSPIPFPLPHSFSLADATSPSHMNTLLLSSSPVGRPPSLPPPMINSPQSVFHWITNLAGCVSLLRRLARGAQEALSSWSVSRPAQRAFLIPRVRWARRAFAPRLAVHRQCGSPRRELHRANNMHYKVCTSRYLSTTWSPPPLAYWR